MFNLLLIVGCVFVVVALVSYLKNVDPDIRKKQINTATKSAQVATGFALVSSKKLIDTATNLGKAGSVVVERNHRGAVDYCYDGVTNYIAEKGGKNGFKAGGESAKDMFNYIGMDDLNKSLEAYNNGELK